MSHHDRDASVEFLLSDPDDGPDEELVPPVGFPRLRRARLPLVVAGGVALIALVVVNLIAGPRGTPSAGPATVTIDPTPPTSASPSVSASLSDSSAGQHRRIHFRIPSGQVSCAVGASCDVWLFTPARVAAAIHHALPGARHLKTVSSTEHQDAPGSHLLRRHITARVGRARLTIEVRPAGDRDVLGWNASETAARTLVTVRDHTGGRLVVLRLVGAPGYHLDLGRRGRWRPTAGWRLRRADPARLAQRCATADNGRCEARDPQRPRRSLRLLRHGRPVVARAQGRPRTAAVARGAAGAGRPRCGCPVRCDRGVPVGHRSRDGRGRPRIDRRARARHEARRESTYRGVQPTSQHSLAD